MLEMPLEPAKLPFTDGLYGSETDEFSQIIIAYEPIWAIGTGLTATSDQAYEVLSFIRDKLVENMQKDINSYSIILTAGLSNWKSYFDRKR